MMTRLPRALLAMPRLVKRAMTLWLDAALCVLTVWLSICLRYEVWLVPTGNQWLPIFFSPFVALPVFMATGLYRAIFRYSGWPALMAVTRAISYYWIVFAFVFTVIGFDTVPRTIGIIQPILLWLAVGGSRAVVYYWLGGHYQSLFVRDSLPKVFIYGAGAAGRQLAAGLSNSFEMNVVGLLDDDEGLHGRSLNGVPIYCPERVSGGLAVLVARHDVANVLLAIPNASRQRRNQIIDSLRHTAVRVQTLPSLSDLAHGKVQVSDLLELDIDDLLGRTAIAPDEALLARNIAQRTVLVTGAGGSIGSELCRQILRVKPTVLLLVEATEFALYAIHQELSNKLEDGMAVAIVPLLASVRDERRMAEIVAAWRPQTIYHAAAYKHVPLVEHNPAEGIANNVFGTWVMARVARDHGVQNFVLISTDKAVRPTNVMGASKRLAELVLQAFAATRSGSCYSMVRFGNVLGSSGSVVPLFRQQIRGGGPITLTHSDITRYFMTIPEAAQLVIQAGAMAVGGDVFVLDMGEPVRIIDLARRMVALSGLSVRDEENPDGDIEIQTTGLRPGEKLYEELLIGDNPLPTDHPRIMKAHEEYLPWAELAVHMEALGRAIEANDIPAIRNLLLTLVPGYQPEAEIVDWVSLQQEKAAGA